MGSGQGNAALHGVKARAVPVFFLVMEALRGTGGNEITRIAVGILMKEIAIQGKDAFGACETHAEAGLLRQACLHAGARRGNGRIAVNPHAGVFPADFLQHGVHQGRIRGGKKDADMAAVPQVAGPGGKGSAEFVPGSRLAVKEDMLAAAWVVKVQNGSLGRGRQARAFRILQGGKQLDGTPFITGGQHGQRAPAHGQAGGVSRFHAGHGPFRSFIIGNQVFFHPAAGRKPHPHQDCARAHPFHEGAPRHFPLFFRKKSGVALGSFILVKWGKGSQTGG